VTVLEKTKEISEIGAGINIPPNASRILHRFGILPEVMKHANCLDKCSLRRYHDNEEVGSIPLMPKVQSSRPFCLP
jgi:salicylate hydroxylase